MRKVVAAFNMTLDGIADHTAGIPDEELHQHYTELLNNGAVIFYGRTTYQLMQFWQELLEKPAGKKSMDDFAIAIDKIHKLVFSSSLKDTGWNSAKLAEKSLAENLLEFKQQPGKDILIGSRSLIIQLLDSNLIDEFQICIHPVLEGKGLQLFDQLKNRRMLKLLRTKIFKSGAVILYYQPQQ